jgi:hypothetical protein
MELRPNLASIRVHADRNDDDPTFAFTHHNTQWVFGIGILFPEHITNINQ